MSGKLFQGARMMLYEFRTPLAWVLTWAGVCAHREFSTCEYSSIDPNLRYGAVIVLRECFAEELRRKHEK